jgi:tight adherence protein B
VNPVLLTLLTFLAGAFIVAAIYSILSDLYLRDRTLVSKRMDEEFRKSQREKARQSRLFKDLGELASDAGVDDDDSPTLTQRLEVMIEQSRLNLTVQRLLAIMASLGLGLGVLAWLMRRDSLMGVIGAVIGVLAPLMYVRTKQKIQLRRLLAQLPDAFDLMARVIRAGQTISQALLAVADEFDQPIAGEFSYCYEQQNLGLSPELAMRDLARRTGLLEIKIFVLAMLVQQQTGGNLAELLDKLATVVRERFRLLAKIQALTAEGRFQAAILLAMPPALFVMIFFLNRSYAQVLLNQPTLLVMVFIGEVTGALWIRKIINFDF